MGVSSHILVLGGACVIKLYVGVGHGRRWQGMHYLGTAIGTWNTQPQPFTIATLSSFSTKHCALMHTPHTQIHTCSLDRSDTRLSSR